MKETTLSGVVSCFASLCAALQDGSEADRLIDEILKNAPVDAPLTNDEIQQEINAVRYAV